MPAGSNLGGNLSVFLFEVGFIDAKDEVGEGSPFTVGLHPLVIVPSEITYTDTSRSPTLQTAGGAIKTSSGRALRRVNFRGSFGVESAGLGIYVGTGETRFQRFYKEVVRMGEARDTKDTKAAVDILRGTPGLPLLLSRYDPDRHVPYINFYDFWNEREFSCTIRSWTDSRHHQKGGATGLVHYQMAIEEDGPIVVAGLGSKLIQGLFAGLTTWSAINDALESYTLGAVFESIAAIPNIAISQFNETLSAVNGQIQSATALVGGFTPPSSTAVSTSATAAEVELLASFFSQSNDLATQSDDLVQTTAAITPITLDEATGAIDWSDDGSPSVALDSADQLDALEDVADAARWQGAAGVLFGWDREEYQAYLTGQSEGGRGNDIEGSTTYTVVSIDTEERIEDRFGVSWDRILEVNGLTPDEALFEGTVLQIPVVRARGSKQTIDGLPTFGSHVGQAAWGTDLTTALDVTEGDFQTLEGEDLLLQGSDWLISLFGEPLIGLMDQIPALLRPRYIRLQLESALLSDARITSIEDVGVVLESATTIAEIEVTMAAINGGEIQTGGAS